MKSKILSIVLFLLIINCTHAQNTGQAFIDKADAFFKEQVVNGDLNYAKLKGNTKLASLITAIENFSLKEIDSAMKQAFLVNAYNLLVIDQIVKNYPLKSVQDVTGFFDKKNVTLSGKRVSLNEIEKDLLLKEFNDARFHFVLVCGAKGCPPITNFAYQPDRLEEQLNQQTKLALNDDDFLNTKDGVINISQIFNWYAKDFGSDKQSVIQFINQYRTKPVNSDSRFNYINYDWSLNELAIESSPQKKTEAKNTLRYVVSSTISKGSVEIKLFNNLYSQKTGVPDNLTNRSTFFTTSLSALYGLTNRFNIGINSRFRRVRNDNLPSSPFGVLGNQETANSARTGLTAFGPQIRYAPVPKWGNFSIQSSFLFATGQDLAGNNTQPYIDWNGPTWITQFFNDFTIGQSFSLFTEIDLWVEDIGKSENNHANRISTPITTIFSYNPIPNMTLYTLGSYSPFWLSDFDYFYQLGLGVKYQFTPQFELELLFTDFSNKFLNDTGGGAATYNFGIRYNL